jgi:invasion protein IalB
MRDTSNFRAMIPAIAVLALALSATGSVAQQAGAKASPAWVKLCEKSQFLEPDPKDAKKPIQKERQVCLTHHERIDATTGSIQVSAAIRETEGMDKKIFMMMLPLGMAIQPGLLIGVYPPDMWAAIQKGERVDDSKIEPLKLGYTLCHMAGCSAELEATPDLIKKLQGGGGMIAFASSGSGAPIAFPAPLNGFSEALAGKPVDSKVYYDERKKLVEQLEANRRKAAEEFRKQNLDLQAVAPKPQGQATPPTPAVATPAAPAPAKKP